MADVIQRTGRSAAVALLRLYQILVSPLLGPSCRFHPTCSRYAIEAIETRGLLIGSWLAALRLLRCSPLSMGGFDPVPAGGDKPRVIAGSSDGI